MRDTRWLALALLGLASALCCATEEARVLKTGDDVYRFLIWNLALAWIPLLLAVAAAVAARREAHVAVAAAGILWILFFPNAPYVLTDFVHLDEVRTTAPLWYDALMIASFAWTALILGLASLYVMQAVVQRYVGVAWSWIGVVAALGFASFGVYLGRFVHFNSWDALVRPRRVLQVIAHRLDNPIDHPRMLGVLMVLTAFLLVAYGIVYAIAGIGRTFGSRSGI
jgi:uncharacterized membrane protein